MKYKYIKYKCIKYSGVALSEMLRRALRSWRLTNHTYTATRPSEWRLYSVYTVYFILNTYTATRPSEWRPGGRLILYLYCQAVASYVILPCGRFLLHSLLILYVILPCGRFMLYTVHYAAPAERRPGIHSTKIAIKYSTCRAEARCPQYKDSYKV